MRRPAFARLASSLVLGAALAAGCAAPDDDAASSEEAITTSKPIAPVDLLSCWVKPDTSTTDAFFQAHEVTCQVADTGDYPLVPQMHIVEVVTARHNVLSGDPKREATVLGRIRNEDFPLTFRTRLIFPSTTSTGDQFGLKDTRVVATLADATADKPIAYKSPFSLWGVEITSKDGSPLYVQGNYTVSTGAYKSGFNFPIPDADKSELRVNLFNEGAGGKAELALIAPATGKISLSVYGTPFEIDGPGSYVFEGGQLTKNASAPPPDPAPTDLTPPPAPTCGGDGQAKCPSGECAVGHRLVNGTCRACGAEGQTWCGDWNQKTCNPGHRLANDTCTACGTAGKTWCGDWNQKTCNGGLRLVNDVCTPCGAAGQTWCGTYDSKTCNDGHRLVNDTCAACGAEGQTYCGTYSDRKCNPGLRVVNDRCAP